MNTRPCSINCFPFACIESSCGYIHGVFRDVSVTRGNMPTFAPTKQVSTTVHPVNCVRVSEHLVWGPKVHLFSYHGDALLAPCLPQISNLSPLSTCLRLAHTGDCSCTRKPLQHCSVLSGIPRTWPVRRTSQILFQELG